MSFVIDHRQCTAKKQTTPIPEIALQILSHFSKKYLIMAYLPVELRYDILLRFIMNIPE